MYYKKFIPQLFTLVLIISAVAFLIFGVVTPESYFRLFPVQILVLVVMTILSHLRLSRLGNTSISLYFSAFVQLMALKLFVYIGFLAASMYFDRENTVVMGISFMLNYLVFTIFEIAQLQSFMKGVGSSKSKP